MNNRAPSTVWYLRPLPKCVGYVRTEEHDRIAISLQDPDLEVLVHTWSLSRKDARLLAKRVNQCLDATVKR